MWHLAKKGNFDLRIKCVVYKQVQCHQCTREEAEKDPWKYAVEERDDGLVDWEIVGIESDN